MIARILRVLFALALIVSVVPVSTALAEPLGTEPFYRTWARTDLPVAQGTVDRTWMWGPEAFTEAFHEPYHEAPGGMRLVQYTDKSRMEDMSFRDLPPWDVTNGLLALELISGRMQLGDSTFEARSPAGVQVAGDPHPDTPTYASFASALDRDPQAPGMLITQTVDRNGMVDQSVAVEQFGVTAAHHVPATNHTVASVFWEFMNSSGLVYEAGQTFQAPLFENPFYATGLPITGAYWMQVPVGGQWQNVLAQCFERRCLTYTPGNAPGWQVEAGNIGQHYYEWRHPARHQPAPDPGPVLPPTPDPEELDPAVAEYAEIIEEVTLVTYDSFEVLLFLLENPTFTDEWFEYFDLVMIVWLSFHPYLSEVVPPPGFEPFHNQLLTAYYTLGQAAEHMIVGIYWLDEWSLNQAGLLLDQFADEYEYAWTLLPAEFLDSGSSTVAPVRGSDQLPDLTAYVDALSEKRQEHGQ